MITTGREDYYNRLRLLRQHGMSVNDRVRHNSATVIIEDHLEIGYNYRLTDIQAAVGIKQLEKLDWLVNERRKIAERYNKAFIHFDFVKIPTEGQDRYCNYQSYSLYLKNNSKVKRNELMQKLLDEGISTRRGVMTTHRETAYKEYCKNISLPLSEDLSDNSIILPLYVPMTDPEIDYVIEKVSLFLSQK
jgi:dTDP-4-amino-4,6-dideoxygalactose transaminase